LPLVPEVIAAERLSLEPLRVEDAETMAELLDDPRLHEFTGGQPLGPSELRARFEALVVGSTETNVVWLNWVVCLEGKPIGTVQATVVNGSGGPTAHVAWVIGLAWQGQGFASEAARALVAWLHAHEVRTILAHIHPEHEASAGVAARAGLSATRERADGEQVWRAHS
jgi:RimJ/RimL family protein N-acetyltransferase